MQVWILWKDAKFQQKGLNVGIRRDEMIFCSNPKCNKRLPVKSIYYCAYCQKEFCQMCMSKHECSVVNKNSNKSIVKYIKA